MLAAGSRIRTAPRRRRLGQHFLADPGAVRRTIEAIPLLPGDGCLEIGAGRGALTLALVDRVAPLTAVEVDPALAEPLAQRLAGHPARPRLLAADALTVPLDEVVSDLRARGARRVQACGNLPYSVATPVLLRLLERADLFAGFTFMVQKEVADRILAPPGTADYGLLSVMVALRGRARRHFNLGPRAFAPPPKVESSVIGLEPHAPGSGAVPAPDAALRLARLAFAHRRKTLVNNLKAAGADWRAVETELEALGHRPNARAQDLSPDDFVRLAARLSVSESGT